MKSASRTSLLVILLPLMLGVACDPQGPGAMGQLIVSPDARLDDGRTLELRLLPDDGKPFDPASTDLSDPGSHRSESWDLADVDFPFQYGIGGGLGTSEHEQWRLVAWIAKSVNVDRPKPDEWYGTRLFNLHDCGVVFSNYCGVTVDVDLELELAQADVSPQRVESELGPGKYIERSFGNYTMRCREGDDSARSIGTFIVGIYASEGAGTEPKADRLITEITGDRDGEIQNCWMTNIDSDENLEVLIFSRSAGSGAYAQLQVYKFDGSALYKAELPEPDASLMDGYQGRDWYELSDGKLLRNFPLYREADANCCPDGGDRVIEYDGLTGSWKLPGI